MSALTVASKCKATSSGKTCKCKLAIYACLKKKLTAGDSFKLLQQLDVGVGLDGGVDVRLAAGGVQQGVVVEQAAVVGALHGGQDVLGHVAVKVLRVGLQSVKEA